MLVFICVHVHMESAPHRCLLPHCICRVLWCIYATHETEQYYSEKREENNVLWEKQKDNENEERERKKSNAYNENESRETTHTTTTTTRIEEKLSFLHLEIGKIITKSLYALVAAYILHSTHPQCTAPFRIHHIYLLAMPVNYSACKWRWFICFSEICTFSHQF